MSAPSGRRPGRPDRILLVDRVGTGAFVVAATAGAAFPDRLARPAAGVHLVLFTVGLVAFLAAFARAVGRSRTEAVDVFGVFLLGGHVAPRQVRRELRWLLAAQVVVALAAASIRPYTAVAFAILSPLFGMGLAGLWGATHGRFGPRATGPRGRPHADGAAGDRADLAADD